jgi:WD40 repeat protein
MSAQTPVDIAFEAHEEQLSGIVVSHDGKLFATFDDNSVIVWEDSGKKQTASFAISGENNIRAVAISWDNKFIAISLMGQVQVFSLVDKRPVQTFEYDILVDGISFSPIGNQLAVIAFRKTFIENYITKERIRELPGALMKIRGAFYEYCADGQKVINYGYQGPDQYIYVLDAASGARLSAIKLDAKARSVVVHPDSKRIAVFTLGEGVEIFSLDNYKRIQKIRDLEAEHFGQSVDGSHLVLVGQKINFYTYDGELIKSASVEPSVSMFQPCGFNLLFYRWLNSESFIEVTDLNGTSRYTMLLKKPTNHEKEKQRFAPKLMINAGHSESIKITRLSSNERFVVTAGEDKRVVIWNRLERRQIGEIHFENPITDIAISPDNKYLAISTTDDVTVVELTNNQKVIRKYEVYSVESLSFSSINSHLLLVSGGSVDVMDYLRGNSEKTIPNNKWDPQKFPSIEEAYYVQNSSKILVRTSDHIVRLIDAITWTDKTIYKHPVADATFLAMALSDDMKELFIATYENTQTKVSSITLLSLAKKELLQLDRFPETLATAKNANLLLICTDVAVYWFDLTLGQIVNEVTMKSYNDRVKIAVMSNGLIIAKGKEIAIYNDHYEKLYSLLSNNSPIARIAFHPERPEMILVSETGDLQVISLRNGKLIKGYFGDQRFGKLKPDIHFSATDRQFILYNEVNQKIVFDLDSYVFLSKQNLPLELHYGQNFFSGYYRVDERADKQQNVLLDQINSCKLITFDHQEDLGGKLKEGEFIKGAEYTSDGRYLVVLGNGTLSLWDTNSYKRVFHYNEQWVDAITLCRDANHLYFHANMSIYKLDFQEFTETTLCRLEHEESVGFQTFSVSADEKFVGIVNKNSRVELVDVSTGKAVLNLIVTGKDHLLIDGDGYYFASRSNYKELSFLVNDKTFPFEQFDVLYNRPDLVMAKLPYADPGLVQTFTVAHEKRTKRTGTQSAKPEDILRLPKVSVVRDSVSQFSLSKVFPFTINASDEENMISVLSVFVNDVPVFGSKGLQMASYRHTLEKQIQIELEPGRNKVQVYVTNEKGIESLKETFEVYYNGAEERPTLYVVNIGVSQFKDASYNLMYAAKDAKDLGDLCRQKTDYYENVKILSITDADALRGKIKAARTFLKQSKTKDVVLVSVATHGLFDENMNYYLATTDVNFENPSRNGLAYEDFEALFDSIPARKKIVFIDACHSGEIDKDDSQIIASAETTNDHVKSRGFKTVASKSMGYENALEFMKQMFADIRKGTGAVVISAASGKEFAFESETWNNGVFTYSILDGLKTGAADLDQDSKITVSELKEYLTRRVEELTYGKQHPTSRADNLEFDFRIW